MAENMNLLDQLSRGNVVFGIGSGYAAAEGIGFGIKFDDGDPPSPTQPKPRWILEWGLRRNQNPGPR
mgnify:CR=1 FL=1